MKNMGDNMSLWGNLDFSIFIGGLLVWIPIIYAALIKAGQENDWKVKASIAI